jgi:hypothetical protein
MKTLTLIIATLITNLLFSQTTEQSILLQDERMKLAGQELIQYEKDYSKALKFTAFSSGLAVCGTLVAYSSITEGSGVNKGQYGIGIGLFAVGSVMTLVGTTKIITSKNHIRNAGLILTGNGVGVQIRL